MPASALPLHANRLLASLPVNTRTRVIARCQEIDLEFGDIVCEADRPLRHIYFPLQSFISLVTNVGTRQALEIGLVGNEGMLGATLALGLDRAPVRGLVQGAGATLRMSVPSLQRALREMPELRNRVHRYIYVGIVQLAQVAVCARFHSVDARLARWLLMTHDRAHADNFRLTHAFIAGMLGVRRSGVTMAAGALQERHLIRYARGAIDVLDRRGLEKASCDCYGRLLSDYDQGLGSTARARLLV